MHHVYVIVSRIYGRLFLYFMNSKSDATYTRTYLLMRKQCLMFMLLLAASTADSFCTSWTANRTPLTQGLISWWENNASCLCYCLAASERTEKNPLKIKFRKDIVESYKPIVWAEPRPICRMSVICRITTYFYLTCSFAVWVCTLEPRQP